MAHNASAFSLDVSQQRVPRISDHIGSYIFGASPPHHPIKDSQFVGSSTFTRAFVAMVELVAQNGSGMVLRRSKRNVRGLICLFVCVFFVWVAGWVGGWVGVRVLACVCLWASGRAGM